MFFPDQEYRVAEDIGEVLIPVLRTGDLSDETMVICSTVQGLCCVCLRVHALVFYIIKKKKKKSSINKFYSLFSCS